MDRWMEGWIGALIAPREEDEDNDDVEHEGHLFNVCHL